MVVVEDHALWYKWFLLNTCYVPLVGWIFIPKNYNIAVNSVIVVRSVEFNNNGHDCLMQDNFLGPSTLILLTFCHLSLVCAYMYTKLSSLLIIYGLGKACYTVCAMNK